MPELGIGNLARALCIGLRNHPKYFLLGRLLAHHFQNDSQLVRVDLPARVLVKRAKRLVALGVFFLRQAVIVLISHFFCHFQKSIQLK